MSVQVYFELVENVDPYHSTNCFVPCDARSAELALSSTIKIRSVTYRKIRLKSALKAASLTDQERFKKHKIRWSYSQSHFCDT